MLRVALILGAGSAMALLVAGVTLAGTHRKALPATVVKWSPWDAGARASLAEQQIATGVSGDATRQSAKRLAETALLRDPTQVDAARALGVLAAFEGRWTDAERLLSYAQTLSRRDVPVQFWFIERKAQLGDVDGVLTHYDTVLRTSLRGRDLLFPILVRAVDDPIVFEGLRARFAGNPPWARDFLTQLISSQVNPEHIAGLAVAVLDGTEPADKQMRQRLLARLVDRNAFEVAYRAYASMASPSDAKLALRNGDFEQASRYPPVDWELAATPDLAALPQPVAGRDGLALQLHTTAGMGGVMARQLLRLPGGGYRFDAVVANVPATPAERPSLELRCANPGQSRILETDDFPEAGAEGRKWQFDFHVPADRCDYQWLTIRVRGTLGARRDTPWVDEMTMSHIG